MSTELTNISAKIEVPDTINKVSNYLDRTIFLNSFYGGNNRGKSLQITFYDEEDNGRHFQLDKENVEILKQILQEF